VNRAFKLAVFGNPISHSRSPDIHRMFADQTNIVLRYEKIEAPVHGFADAVNEFVQEGGTGFNVTVPFKQAAFQLVTDHGQEALQSAAVNTVSVREDGLLYGDNTDGRGLCRDLERLGWTVADKRLLIIGAGGAVSGVTGSLLASNPRSLHITNRTHANAEALVNRFSDSRLKAVAPEQLDAGYDLIINASSAGLLGLGPDLPPHILNPESCCYDMVYGTSMTAFLAWAEEHGALQGSDGLGMLVCQAAEAFFIWFGLRVEVASVIREFRQ